MKIRIIEAKKKKKKSVAGKGYLPFWYVNDPKKSIDIFNKNTEINTNSSDNTDAKLNVGTSESTGESVGDASTTASAGTGGE